MKNFTLLSVLFVITTLSFGQISGTIRFSSDDYELRDTLISNNEPYAYFSSNPYEFVETPGLPCLPVRYDQFILPYGMRIDSIIISVSDQDTIKLSTLLFPKQHAIASCLGCQKPAFKNIDSSVYFSNDPFPVALAETQNYGYWHTSNIATVGFYPYHYYPSINKLIPSHLDNGGGGILQLKLQQDGTEAVISDYTGQMLSLKDGGNTQELKEDIVYSLPPEALMLRDELLTKSPYLSDTAMKSAAANEFVLPNVMIRDILIANPQSASGEPVLTELDKRFEPMPEDLYNQILDAESAYSPLEIREMELASLKTKQSWLFNFQLNCCELFE